MALPGIGPIDRKKASRASSNNTVLPLAVGACDSVMHIEGKSGCQNQNCDFLDHLKRMKRMTPENKNINVKKTRSTDMTKFCEPDQRDSKTTLCMALNDSKGKNGTNPGST
jgi:hypothetical protein